MFIVMKTNSWIDDGRPFTGVGVEEMFTGQNKAMIYIGRKLEELKGSKRFDTILGEYPQIVAHDKEVDEWIQYYVQEKKVTI